MSIRVGSVRSGEGHPSKGFTLIELLVVIAIIAILASILFPVFAQARAKARQSASLSNIRQMGMGVLQYAQDYDDTYPRFRTRAAEEAAPTNYRRTALGFVYDYIKNVGLYKSPDQVDTEPDIFAGGNMANVSIWTGYAWNVDYLNFSADCSDWGDGAGNNQSGPPTALGAVAQPASTVMAYGYALRPGTGSFAGANALYPINGGYYFGTAPATLTTPEACCYSNAGWGQGSWGGPFGGFEQPRNGQGGAVVFCDGHVKFMTAGQLAAGTNWNPTIANSAITVTDRNQYLWDLQ